MQLEIDDIIKKYQQDADDARAMLNRIERDYSPEDEIYIIGRPGKYTTVTFIGIDPLGRMGVEFTTLNAEIIPKHQVLHAVREACSRFGCGFKAVPARSLCEEMMNHYNKVVDEWKKIKEVNYS